jgi:hypothetical protein
VTVELTKRAEPKRWGSITSLVQVGWFVIAAAGAAYLWAVIFGDGISGLTDGYTLGQRPNSDLPNANVALIAAVGAYVGSPMFAWWSSSTSRFNTPRWLLLTASVGLVVFATSRLFV